MKASSFTLLFLLLASTLSAQVSSGMWFPHQAVSDEVYQLLRKDGIKRILVEHELLEALNFC